MITIKIKWQDDNEEVVKEYTFDNQDKLDGFLQGVEERGVILSCLCLSPTYNVVSTTIQ
tara:strand:- start:60 stop:236 length:177 start_codon:yes stop_codon:yes gene_type:complete